MPPATTRTEPVPRAFATLLSAVLACALWIAGTTALRAADAVAIVFDGSGSMWGRLGATPQSKLVAARDAVVQGLAQAPDLSVGLVTFGRRRGDCSDVELVAPVDGGDRQRIVAPLERMNPRGRGPITLALRTAAKALEGQIGRRHVLIVHDEPDNCSLDTCAAAAELKAADPALVVSTVILGASPDDIRATACIAEQTGGRSYAVDTPADAAQAIAAALRSDAETRPAPAPSAAVRRQGAPPPAALRGGPPRARLIARLGPSGGPLTRQLQWRIWPAAADGGATLAESTDAEPDIALEPGRYRVEVRAGLARALKEFEIASGGVTAVELTLDAGIVRSQALLRRGGPPSPAARISVTPDARESAPLWVGPPGDLVLPSGTYWVVASEGRVRAHQRVQLAAGQTAPVDLLLAAGRLTLSAVARDGGPALDDVVYRVLESDPDAPSGFREVSRTADANAELVLPAGTYQIVARQGAVEARERIAVVAGEDVRYVFRIGVGRVVASARWPNGSLSPETMSYTLTALDLPGAEVVQTVAAEATLFVAPGRYRLEARLGPANAAVARDIEVRSGADQRVQLVLAAADVEFRPSEALASLALAESFWEISDPSGRIVWRTVQPRPRAALMEGRYKVRLATRSRAVEKTFEVKSGGPVIVTVGDE